MIDYGAAVLTLNGVTASPMLYRYLVTLKVFSWKHFPFSFNSHCSLGLLYGLSFHSDNHHHHLVINLDTNSNKCY